MISFLRVSSFLFVSTLTILAEKAAWRALPSLPPEAAGSGLFAGTSDGQLVVGGGCRPGRPAEEGDETKIYHDRVLLLSGLEATWQESATRLPEPRAHAAVAAGHDCIYLVGGENDSGLLKSGLILSAREGQITLAPLPALPHALAYGAAVVVGQALYVAGGVQSLPLLEPSSVAWRLSLSADGKPNGQWEKLPDLPDDGAFAPAAGTDGKDCYIFGGGHFVIDPEARISPLPLSTAYRLKPGSAQWEKLPDLPAARLETASPCGITTGGEILLAGGYETVFGGAPQHHPGFAPATFLFQPKAGTWGQGPSLSALDDAGTMRSAAVRGAASAMWNGAFVIVSGERLPGQPTLAVLSLSLD